MRPILFAVATLALFASAVPVLADDAADLTAAKAAIAAAKLSPASDLNMWCGAAMTLFSQVMKTSDADKSKVADTNASNLYAKAAVLLAADGVKQADFTAMSTNYMTVAASELMVSTGSPEHTQEECQAAADAK